MQRIHIDIVGLLPRSKSGKRYILTVQCSFTKWAEAFAIPNQRATTCARVLVKNWVCRYGVPDSIHSDQGRNFESQVFEEMCHFLEINKTRSTAYHPEGNGQIENLHKTLRSMLKARVEDDPQIWDEHLDYCMMAFRSSVHSSTGHTPFELMFEREMRIPVDVIMGRAEIDERNYSEFVSDLQSSLETAYRDVRESLRTAQRREKDFYDKGVKHIVFQTGGLVLRYTPQLKPGEANKFHRWWEGPFDVVERVTDVTYLVKKVRRRSRRSQVVHFNNLRLYQKRQEAQLGKPVAGGSVDASQGGSEETELAAPAGGELEPVESDTVDGGTEDEVIGVEAAKEFFDEFADVQDESSYQSCLADTASVGEFGQGGGCDQENRCRIRRKVNCQKMFKMITRAWRRTEKTNTR